MKAQKWFWLDLITPVLYWLIHSREQPPVSNNLTTPPPHGLPLEEVSSGRMMLNLETETQSTLELDDYAKNPQDLTQS